MKNFLYILSVFYLCLLSSCAEEGPFPMGRMEANVNISKVTPTTALVNISIPKSSGNVLSDGYCKIFVTDSRNQGADFKEWDDNRLIECENMEYNGNTVSAIFIGLKPATKYSVVIRTPFKLNDGGGGYSFYYFTGDTFTTAEVGDY